MTDDFLRNVELAFTFLRDEPGQEHLVAETSDSFDNASVYFRSGGLRVRILRERGQVFADFAPLDGPSHWFDAPTLIGYLGNEALVARYARSDQRSLAALVDFVRPFCDAFAVLYSATYREDNVWRIRAFRNEQARLRWG